MWRTMLWSKFAQFCRNLLRNELNILYLGVTFQKIFDFVIIANFFYVQIQINLFMYNSGHILELFQKNLQFSDQIQ